MDKIEGEGSKKDGAETSTTEEISFGSWLKNQRLEKKISLEEIAAVTKVHIAQLRALEENDAKKLPAAAFVRGFLVTYARHLGLEEDVVLQRYKGHKELLGGAITDMLVPEDNKLGRSLSHPKVRIVTPPQFNPAATTKPHLDQKPSSTINIKMTLWGLLFLGVVVLIGSLIAVGKKHKTETQPEVDRVEATKDSSTSTSVAETPLSTTTTQTPLETEKIKKQDTSTSKESAPTKLSKAGSTSTPASAMSGPQLPMNSLLEIRALDDNFITIRVDDGTARGINLKAGTLSPFPANRRIRLTMSNAGAVEFKWNGVWYAAPGTRGEVKLLVFPDQISSLTVKPAPVKIKTPAPTMSPAVTTSLPGAKTTSSSGESTGGTLIKEFDRPTPPTGL